MPIFRQREKKEHYTAVANGTKPVKSGSKFSKAEQLAYARGQRDARNENAARYKYKNSTPSERAAYRAKQQKRAEAYKKGKM